MSIQTTDHADLDPRDARALTECMVVCDDVGRAKDVPGMVLVVGEGSDYLVDTRGGACECPDARHRDPAGGCKHVRRVAFERGRPIPAWADRSRIDPLLLQARQED